MRNKPNPLHVMAWGICLSLYVGCEGAGSLGPDQAEVKTLDDFASGSSVDGENVCAGPHGVKIDDARIQVDTGGPSFRGGGGTKLASESKDAVRGYLTALPPAVQASFQNLNGRILVTDKASEWCGAGMSDPSSYHFVGEKRRMLGCFLYLDAKGDQYGDVFTIVHAPDVAAIRHEGVRLFGFLYAQYFPRLRGRVGSDGNIRYDLQARENSKLYTLKRELANAFLRDASRLPSGLKPLEPLLGVGAAERLMQKISRASLAADVLANEPFRYANDPAAWGMRERAASTRLQRFQDFVFAEAFDSYHCNQEETRPTMAKTFPLTDKSYATIDAAIMGMAARLASGQVSGTKGMALVEEFVDMSDFFPMPSWPTITNPNAMWGLPGLDRPAYPVYGSDYSPYTTHIAVAFDPDGYDGYVGGGLTAPPDTLMDQGTGYQNGGYTSYDSEYGVPTGYDPYATSTAGGVIEAGTGSFVALGAENTTLGLRSAH